MASLTGFDASQVEPSVAFEPIPAGKYVAKLVESTQKPTKDAKGKFLELKFQILDGPCQGRFVWTRLCLEHANPVTIQIARAQLSALCRCVGVLQPRDSVELHNLPVVIVVRLTTRKDTREPTNEIKGFEKHQGAGQAPQANTVPNGGNSYAGTTPPWKR